MGPLRDFPFLLVFFLMLIFAEFLWRIGPTGKGYSLSGTAASFGVALGNVLVRPLSATVSLAVAEWLYAASPFPMKLGELSTWLIGFVAVDFAFYWFHRLSHRVRWLWATHAVHHSTVELVLTSAFRLGWTELVSGGWIVFVSLAWLGLPPSVIGASLAFNLLFQLPLHTEAIDRLGPLEWIFNTPSHHRTHHSSDRAFLDCNFGGIFIFWDRLFGTFRAEPTEKNLTYGLRGREDTVNPFTIALREWVLLLSEVRKTDSITAALKVMFGRP